MIVIIRGQIYQVESLDMNSPKSNGDDIFLLK